MGHITFENVTKRFRGVEAVRHVSLDIPDQQFTVIVGPSGSGKTTMLRSIAGLERIDEGKILLGGRDVTDLAPKERDVAFVFQNYALYGHLSVARNIGFPLRAQKVPRAEIKARVEDVAGRLGLKDLLDRRPKELSGGQQQRVAIGRAIIREPAVYLFDEPLSNLDAQLRVEMRKDIIQLQAGLGVTSVWVTHDQEEAMAMGDEILVVNKGIVEQQDAPEHIYSKPANLYVATTIGSPPMNVFRGRSSGTQFKGDIDLSLRPAIPTGDVAVGVRPEDLRLCDGPEDGSSIGVIEADVQIIEPLGPRAIVTLSAGGSLLTAVFDRRMLARISEGTAARITADRARLHIFDGETGVRRADVDLASPPDTAGARSSHVLGLGKRGRQ